MLSLILWIFHKKWSIYFERFKLWICVQFYITLLFETICINSNPIPTSVNKVKGILGI